MDHGPTYEDLDSEAAHLAAEMGGSTLFAAVAKQTPVCEVEMPSSLLMEMHAHLMRTAQFGCSFSKEALRARAVNKVSITREKDELKKIANHKRGTLSVQNAVDLLTEL